MTRLSITIVAATALALTIGCGEGTPPIDPFHTGGETHWLENCESDGECETGLECLCGVCTQTCFEDEDTCGDEERAATCVEASAIEACNGQAPAGAWGVCVAECESDADCSNGEVCSESLCVPDTESIPDRWLIFEPDSVAFEAGDENVRSVRDVTVHNVGPERVQIIGISQAGSGNFSMGVSITQLPITILPGKEYIIPISFQPTDARPSRGSIQFETTAPDGKTGVSLHAPGRCGTLVADQRALDFGEVVWGESRERIVTLLNDGLTEIRIDDISIDGAAFSFDTPVSDGTLLPHETLRLRVHFGPAEGAQDGVLLVDYANDCDSVEPLEVPLTASGAAPCIATSYPGGLDFGALRVGDTIEESIVVLNCAPQGSEAPLEILEASLIATGDDDISAFELVPPADASPLAPGDHAEYTIRFSPRVPGGQSVSVRFDSNSLDNPTVEVDVEGLGEADACESLVMCSVGGSAEPLMAGDVVSVGERVVCTSDVQSTDQISEIMWRWRRTPFAAPEIRARDNGFEMSTALFAPGVYAISASAFDADQEVACAPEEFWFAVVPEEELLVLLTWETPGDTDLGDSGPGTGADVDLVFRRPGGSWDEPSDLISFANPVADWGAEGFDDDPRLIVDDSDGRGPEVIVVPRPESGEYAIGARYFSASGYGSSHVTAHVYAHGDLVHTTHSVRLDEDGDFADIARVQWPSGRVLDYRAP